ncbi:hypothetical protein PU629_06255 [Pullulanibacillus sp. KACC 23026]|uniref:hypothetical protein n=1 Tax=Pullulanibacillus sp. KACC 23026 TaxID=3028315 RepID=UPI0023B091B8|nr:hypothetical protein [Pullulanibacillus sp. KACC 23026]WEG13966.1 hypothetical protein PU629_06255 [Pullulanibacillus sp. KACC 23026]
MELKQIISHDYIGCPHCGYKHNDFWEYIEPTDEEGEFLMDCEGCGEEFNVKFSTQITFNTTKKQP